MKTFALSLMMIGTLIAVPMVSAEKAAFGSLDGTYAMIANGSCLHSPAAVLAPTKDPVFGEVYTSTGGPVWAATTFAQAIWTFEPTGSGTVSGTNYVIDFPPGRPINGSPTPNVRKNPIAFTFTYRLQANGEIYAEFDAPYNPPTLPPMYGHISIDRKVISLWSAYELQQGDKVICNTGRTLFRVAE